MKIQLFLGVMAALALAACETTGPAASDSSAAEPANMSASETDCVIVDGVEKCGTGGGVGGGPIRGGGNIEGDMDSEMEVDCTANPDSPKCGTGGGVGGGPIRGGGNN